VSPARRDRARRARRQAEISFLDEQAKATKDRFVAKASAEAGAPAISTISS
jgi:hypothetical protein